MLHIKAIKNKEIATENDKKELAVILEIENKLNQLKRKHGNDERLIFEELIKIKEVQKILIEWGKHLRKSRAGTKKHHQINLGSGTFSGFVQGGATGLKK